MRAGAWFLIYESQVFYGTYIILQNFIVNIWVRLIWHRCHTSLNNTKSKTYQIYFKRRIFSVQRDLHIKMCLETKFYIFWKFFTISFGFLKIPVFNNKKIIKKVLKNRDFQKSERDSKKISKNVKFGLQVHFNMKNMLKGSDRLFELWKWRYEREVKHLLYFPKHRSLTRSKFIWYLFW